MIEENKQTARGRILVVDDEAGSRSLVHKQLSDEGFEVEEAKSGTEALAKALTWNPELILMDIEMPGMDGIETCRRLRALPQAASIPVIFFTGHRADEPTTVEALSAGGRDFVSKAAATPVLVARLLSSLELYRVQRRLEELAMQDALTGVFSRRFLFDALKKMAKSANRRGPADVSLMVIDLDNFKSVNDTRGHLEGDNMLKLLANTILGAIRETDILVRYGGDEFVVVMADTSRENAALVANKIRAAVEAGCSPVTVSVGVACLTSSPEGVRGDERMDELIKELIFRADAAMYEAKAGGRNNVRVCEDNVVG